MRSRIKQTFNLLRGHFPSKLPVGAKEFDEFSDSIIKIYNLPDMPSYRHAIATMIMHLSPQISSYPKAYFARSIRKAMSNEIAYQKIQDYKKQMEEADKARTIEEADGRRGEAQSEAAAEDLVPKA